jgi:hypothetical protein
VYSILVTAVVNKPKCEMSKEKEKCGTWRDVLFRYSTHAHRARASIVIVISGQRLLGARAGTGVVPPWRLCVPFHTTPRAGNSLFHLPPHNGLTGISAGGGRERTHKTADSSCGDRERDWKQRLQLVTGAGTALHNFCSSIRVLSSTRPNIPDSNVSKKTILPPFFKYYRSDKKI